MDFKKVAENIKLTDHIICRLKQGDSILLKEQSERFLRSMIKRLFLESYKDKNSYWLQINTVNSLPLEEKYQYIENYYGRGDKHDVQNPRYNLK